jgi:hypothetical protein
VKLYVAGPMRGNDQFNFPAFDAAAEALRAVGHEVRTPAESDREVGFDPTSNALDGFSMEDALRRDVEMIIWADGVALLDGWQQSRGATAEAAIARWIDKEAKPLADWLTHQEADR